jgi:hypothetical protein
VVISCSPLESLIEEASDLASELKANPGAFNLDRIECPRILLAASSRVGFLSRARRLVFEIDSGASGAFRRLERLSALTEGEFFRSDRSERRIPTPKGVRQALLVLEQARSELVELKGRWSSPEARFVPELR